MQSAPQNITVANDCLLPFLIIIAEQTTISNEVFWWMVGDKKLFLRKY